MLQHKLSYRTQADGRDRRILLKRCFIIAVPGDAVLAVAIKVKQDTVKLLLADLFNPVFNQEQVREPG